MQLVWACHFQRILRLLYETFHHLLRNWTRYLGWVGEGHHPTWISCFRSLGFSWCRIFPFIFFVHERVLTYFPSSFPFTKSSFWGIIHGSVVIACPINVSICYTTFSLCLFSPGKWWNWTTWCLMGQLRLLFVCFEDTNFWSFFFHSMFVFSWFYICHVTSQVFGWIQLYVWHGFYCRKHILMNRLVKHLFIIPWC